MTRPSILPKNDVILPILDRAWVISIPSWVRESLIRKWTMLNVVPGIVSALSDVGFSGGRDKINLRVSGTYSRMICLT